MGIAGEIRRVPGVVAVPLLYDDLVWLAPGQLRGMPLALAPAALEDLVLILPASESSTRALTERILGRAGCHPARTLELDSVEAVKRAVRSGIGVAAVSRLAVADDLAAGKLREVKVAGAGSAERLIEIVRREHREPTPLEDLFVRSLREHCRRPDEDTLRGAAAAHA